MASGSSNEGPKRVAASPHVAPIDRADVLRLAGYAALILFLELALIRYIPAYVKVFGFYVNLVLIATFLGMGVGLLRTDDASRLRWIFLPALPILLLAVRALATVVVNAPVDRDEYVWEVLVEQASVVRQIGSTPVVLLLFLLSALVMLPLGALFGQAFRKFPALTAYSIDIAGSLVGIAAFAALSAARTPPVVWFGVFWALWLLLSWRRARVAMAVALAAAVSLPVVMLTAAQASEIWSPYYRINVYPARHRQSVHVNGAIHQWMIDLDAIDDTLIGGIRANYRRPLELLARLDTVLVVGAGTGNDVANLLALGARHVDAVEIDPAILDLGRMRHPQRPYDDRRVHTHVNDARAFLRRTRQRYDAIIFGTLDSQRLLSGMSSLRLDNYVYTVEAFRTARERLLPGGSIITYHMSANDYIAGKIYRVLERTFDEPPLVWRDDSQHLFNYTFVAGGASHVAARPPTGLDSIQVTVPTDDWPYLFLRDRVVPRHYLAVLGGILLCALAMIPLAAPGMAHGRPDLTMFLLGAGFLLLETKGVTESSLLFGSTWHVNLLVFSSILLVVLAANVLVMRYRPNVDRSFAALLLSLAAAWLIPVRSLLVLGSVGQWVFGGLLVALPVMFAGIIFATLLSARAAPFRALAFNLLGAIMGGMLEYASMLIGTKGLYLVAALVYGLAWLVHHRERPEAEMAAERAEPAVSSTLRAHAT